MTTLKRIMAGVDLSDYSPAVIEYAGELCRKTGAELVIVNVINQRELDAITTVQMLAECKLSREEVVERKKVEYSSRINQLIDRFGLQDLPSRIVFRVGIPYEELIRAVQDEQVQMVVIGPKGRSNVPGLLFGSAAEKVFRHCPVPLLSIRGDIHART